MVLVVLVRGHLQSVHLLVRNTPQLSSSRSFFLGLASNWKRNIAQSGYGLSLDKQEKEFHLSDSHQEGGTGCSASFRAPCG